MIFAGGSSAWGAYSATYVLSNGTTTLSSQTITSTTTDVSGVWVYNTGNLTLSSCAITTSGNTSSADDSSFYGLNAGVLVTSGGTLTMTGGSVTTTGTGANGVFAYGSGSSATLTNVTIHCSGQLGHGVDVTGGATMTLTNLTVTTESTNAAAIATDRGSGTITATGGTFTTAGSDSPGIYSTGAITVTDADITATGSEAAVIEGANSITLTNTTLRGDKKRGVMIYQSMSGDAEGSTGTFTMTGGTLTAKVGPLFYVTNATGVITLTGTTVSLAGETIIDASAGSWGTSGSNGGTATFTADSEMLDGDITADSISSITATLQNNTTLSGAATRAAVNIDSTSSWTITDDSTLTSLTNNGTVTFDEAGLTATISGAYTQSSTGTLSITLNGSSIFDSLAITGTATLAGKLNIVLADGFTPSVGDTFKILTYGSRSGSFETKSTSASGLSYTIEYNSKYTQITITGTSSDTTDTDDSTTGDDDTTDDDATDDSSTTDDSTTDDTTTDESNSTSSTSSGLCGFGVLTVLPFTILWAQGMKWQIRRKR
jgi:hypothetical protein